MRLAALLFPSIMAAQGFGCFESAELPYGGDATLYRDKRIAFEPVRDSDQIAQIQKLPSKRLSGFGSSSPVREVAFFGEIKTPAAEIGSGDSGVIYLDVQRRSSAHEFYRLAAPATDWQDGGGFPFTGGIAEVRVAPATPDRSVPLVVLQTYGQSRGVNTGVEAASRYLLDLRQGQPRSLATVDCLSVSGGGACGAFDSEFSQRHSLSCSWLASQNDFLCKREMTNPFAWGGVTWRDAFYLLSGMAAAPPGISPTAPRAPEEWASQLSTGTAKHTLLPRYGDTFVLTTLPNRVALLASRGNTARLWPRFWLFTPSGTTEIVPRLLAGDPLGSPFEPLPDGISGYLTGAPMSFVITPLRPAPPGLSFFAVALTQGKQHSLFWTGIDYRSGNCAADILWVATDAMEYDNCRAAHVPDSAARAEWIGKNDVLARLDVEPLRSLDYQGEGYYRQDSHGPELACAYDAEIRWSNGVWVVSRKPRECDSGAVTIRAIAVSSEGTISAIPARMIQGQR
jgi:hypothetical protein